MTAPTWDLPVAPGGVTGAPVDLTTLPFGIVELVVARGHGAGAVHRLELGRFRCGPDATCDVVLPHADREITLDVRAGGVVWVGVGDADGSAVGWSPWPLGAERRVAGLDLLLRWCRGPWRGGVVPDVCGRGLGDLLLDRLAGAPMPSSSRSSPSCEPVWELGRDGARVVQTPIATHRLLTITGRHRHALARAVLARLVHAHGPERIRLTVLAPGNADEAVRVRWAWTRWLPHARTCDERFVRVGVDDDTCGRLVTEAVERAGHTTGDGGGSHTPRAWEVVVVDGRAGDLGRVVRPGLAVLVLDESDAEAGAGVSVTAPGPRGRVRGLSFRAKEIDLDLPEQDWADRFARSLTCADEEDAAVRGLRLADLVGIGPGDASRIAELWSGPPTTRVPVGVDDDGEVVAVDLRTDGPHALIGGTTGSGKSELLQTLVAGLATLNPPEAMSFVLVDYKGGAAFAGCARLPHTLGVVTDLDASLTERALASLSAEVRRREQLLADAEAPDLDAYLVATGRPLARLVIVVDEFATLAAELPEFVDGLVDIARRGRSLGLHLVLATQRPAGAVSADIRANTTLRIALRVAESADSEDVIGLPDAVDIDERTPGRALVRVGRNRPLAVQTARVTTVGPGVTWTPYVFGEPIDIAAIAAEPDGPTDLAVLAETLGRLVREHGLTVPPSPWLPPLPVRLDLDGLGGLPDVDGPDAPGEAAEASEGAAGRPVPFGVEDRPSEQRRAMATVRLEQTPFAVVGGARSGRTTALRSIVLSAAEHVGPAELHVYGVDAGARGLVGLDDLPHVGAVVFREESDRLDRLVARLTAELDRRIELLALRRWREAADQRVAEPESPWPSILVVVDRWDLLMEAVEAGEDRGVTVGLERLAAEGGRAGMTVVASGDRALFTSRLASLFPDRLVLRLNDTYDYATIGARGPAGRGEPGRGWRGDDLVETQVADVGGPDGAAAAVGRRATGIARREASDPLETTGAAGASIAWRDSGAGVYPRSLPVQEGGPFRVDPLPGLVTRELAVDLTREPAPAGALLLGVGGDDLAGRWLDADEHGPSVLVTGRRRSGRSGVLLTLAESARRAGWEVAVVLARRSPLEVLTVGTGADTATGSTGSTGSAGSAGSTGSSGSAGSTASAATGAAALSRAVAAARTRPGSRRPRRSGPEGLHGPYRDDEDAAELARVVRDAVDAGRRILVLADDVDLLPDGALADELASLPVALRDTGSLVAASAEPEEVVGSFRGLLPLLRRARCGVMLGPQSAEDGDAFGVRLRRAQYGRAMGPGGGHLVLDGLPERVQVIRSALLPDPGAR